ncbi:MAG: hypothetical protein ACOX52_15640 [Verrucomicrobiota bacterium]
MPTRTGIDPDFDFDFDFDGSDGSATISWRRRMKERAFSDSHYLIRSGHLRKMADS